MILRLQMGNIHLWSCEHVNRLKSGHCSVVVIIWATQTPLLSQFTEQLHAALDAWEDFSFFATIAVDEWRTYINGVCGNLLQIIRHNEGSLHNSVPSASSIQRLVTQDAKVIDDSNIYESLNSLRTLQRFETAAVTK